MSEKRIRLLTNAPVRGVLRSPAEGGGKGILAPIGEAKALIREGKAVDLSEKRKSPSKPVAKADGAGAKTRTPPATPAPPPPPPPVDEA